MIEYEILNLEEIKTMISSFNDLQSAYNLLQSYSIESPLKSIEIKNLKLSEEELTRFKFILNSIQSLIDDLLHITDQNIIIFNAFQNELLAKFKRSYKERLKSLELNKQNLQILGNSLIKNKNISKIVSNISYIHSLKLTQWLELIDSLKENTTFKIIIEKINGFYQDLIKVRLNEQLSMIRDKFDQTLINKYKKAFYENPSLSFSEYRHIYENSLTKEELDQKQDIIKHKREKLELEKLKENQERQDTLYQDYLRLPSKEFERKRRKERRGKLSKIDLKENNNKIEISKETSDKIEKFKNSFDKSLKNRYLVQEDDGKNPIDLIRERKKKKSEEFKKYKKHFEAE
jgi:hypothetical protein